MRLLTLSILIVVGLAVRSCGRKPAPESERAADHQSASTGESDPNVEHESAGGEEAEEAPDSGDIGEDCIAFLRATKVAAPQAENKGNCPQCPDANAADDVFKFNDLKIDRVAPSAGGAEVDVRIIVTFNPGAGGSITGGLTAWIPPEQRAQYERGEIPEGQQVYRVRITYKRNANGWQPIEFAPIAP